MQTLCLSAALSVVLLAGACTDGTQSVETQLEFDNVLLIETVQTRLVSSSSNQQIELLRYRLEDRGGAESIWVEHALDGTDPSCKPLNIDLWENIESLVNGDPQAGPRFPVINGFPAQLGLNIVLPDSCAGTTAELVTILGDSKPGGAVTTSRTPIEFR